jgi:hypothetical protein
MRHAGERIAMPLLGIFYAAINLTAVAGTD